MLFTREDVTALAALIPLVYWQLPVLRRNNYEQERAKYQIKLAPPGWVFGPVWTLMYGLLVANGFIFFRDFETTAGPYYIAIFVIYVVNILLGKLWAPIFFRGTHTARRIALVILLLMLSTGCAVLILQYLSNAVVPASLYAVYIAWLLYALLLNFKWVCLPSSPATVKYKTVKSPVIRAYTSR